MKILASFMMVLVLSGCSPWQEYFPEKSELTEWRKGHQDLVNLLARFHILASLPQEPLLREYDGTLLRLESCQDPAVGLEATFIHALLGRPQKGSKQVKAFLKQIEVSGFPAELEGYKGIADLVNLALNLQQENERLRVRINEEKEHSEKLAHQLKELKNIEKIIYERENHKQKTN